MKGNPREGIDKYLAITQFFNLEKEYQLCTCLNLR